MPIPTLTPPPEPTPNKYMPGEIFVPAANAWVSWWVVITNELIAALAWIAEQVGFVAATAVVRRGAQWSKGGQALDAGEANIVYVRTPVAGTIARWSLMTDGGTGSCEIDVWLAPFAEYPPTDADSIVADAPPELSSAIAATDSVLDGWTTTVAAGDVLAFKLVSSSTFTLVSLELEIVPTP